MHAHAVYLELETEKLAYSQNRGESSKDSERGIKVADPRAIAT